MHVVCTTFVTICRPDANKGHEQNKNPADGKKNPLVVVVVVVIDLFEICMISISHKASIHRISAAECNNSTKSCVATFYCINTVGIICSYLLAQYIVIVLPVVMRD